MNCFANYIGVIELEFTNLLIEKNAHIAKITINRPEVRNALDATTYGEISQAIELFEQDPTISVVILTGAGDKSFAAGADIKQLQQRTPLDALEPGLQGTCRKIEQSSKIVIAAVNGFALGGGCELALACDIRISSDRGKFGLPELNLAIIPGGGGTQRLSRIVGKGKALEMILTGEILDAYKAEQIGLVSKVVPHDQLHEEVQAYVEKIVAKGPLAVRLAKTVVHQGYDSDLTSALMLEKLAQAVLFGSEDKYEGTTAFLEKRQATFAGK